MRKRFVSMITALMTVSFVLSGCSLSKDDSIQSTEYLTDKADEATSENSDASTDGQSVIVAENLFEPILEVLETNQEEEKTEEPTAEESVNEDDVVRIVFFGDSQLANGRNDGSDIPSLLATRVPNTVMYNLAIGGTAASVESTTSDVTPDSLHSQCFLGMTYAFTGKSDRNETLSSQHDVLNVMNSIDPSTVDYYIIEYGANDFFNNAPLDASMYDSQSDIAHAYYNALCMGIDELRSVSPNATFILMTPFYGVYVDDSGAYIGDSYIVSNGIGTLADYAKKMKNVSEDKQTYIFDGMFGEKTDLYVDTAGEYLIDNVHLSLKGRQIFARLLGHLVNYIEKNEPFAYLDTDKIKIAEYDTEETYRYDEGLMKEYYPESWEKYIKGEFPLAQPSQEALDQYNAEQNGG